MRLPVSVKPGCSIIAARTCGPTSAVAALICSTMSARGGTSNVAATKICGRLPGFQVFLAHEGDDGWRAFCVVRIGGHGDRVESRCQMHVVVAGVAQRHVLGVSIGVARGVAEQKDGCHLAEHACAARFMLRPLVHGATHPANRTIPTPRTEVPCRAMQARPAVCANQVRPVCPLEAGQGFLGNAGA